MFWRKPKTNRTALEIADLIERFLDERSLYPQEWGEFVDVRQDDKKLDVYRKRCDMLDPLVNRPGDMDPTAVAELRSMVDELREIGTGSKPETVE
jgi:hypothetical protein